MLVSLYEYYLKNIDELPDEFLDNISNGETKQRTVCDYIAGMSDQYAMTTFKNIYMPKQWLIY